MREAQLSTTIQHLVTYLLQAAVPWVGYLVQSVDPDKPSTASTWHILLELTHPRCWYHMLRRKPSRSQPKFGVEDNLQLSNVRPWVIARSS